MSLFKFLLIIRNVQFCSTIKTIVPTRDFKQNFKTDLASTFSGSGSLAKNDKQIRIPNFKDLAGTVLAKRQVCIV